MPPQHIHFAGIGGIVTSALAAELVRRGFRVTGSDEYILPPASEVLSGCGLVVHDGYEASQVADTVDLAVLGAMVQPGNPVVQEVLRRQLHRCSWPQLLSELGLLAAHNGVVAGTNGKTTTSCMWTWVLQRAGWNPDHVIGGKIADWPTGVRLRGASHCILEGDEFPSSVEDRRPKFVHYQPEVAILLNIQFDHSDVFSSQDEIMAGFRLLAEMLPSHGLLILNDADARCRQIASFARCSTAALGLHEGAPVRLHRFGYSPEGVRFILKGVDFFLPLWGDMNAWNAAAAALAAEYWGIPLEESAKALRDFPGAQDRQKRIRVDEEFVLLADTAYHPDAVSCLLDSLRAHFPGRPLGLVLQPRHTLGAANWQQDLWPDALRHAAKPVIMESLNHVAEDNLFSAKNLCQTLRDRGMPASYATDAAAASGLFQELAAPGDVWVLCLEKWFPQPLDDIVKLAM